MSDKNRNMNDINDQKTVDRTEQAALEQTAEQQAFSEEIRRRLAAPDSGKPTLEEFKVMVYKDREKRRKKRNAMVACVVAAFVVGIFSFEYFVPEVGADKNPKETIQTEDGVIIEDGGYGSSEEERNIFVIEEWENIADSKTIVPSLPIPKHVPTEYSFIQLRVSIVNINDAICEYTFKNNQGKTLELEFIILASGETALDINEVTRTLDSSQGTIYLQKNNTATIQLDDGIILHVWGEISDNEMIKVINSFNN